MNRMKTKKKVSNQMLFESKEKIIDSTIKFIYFIINLF